MMPFNATADALLSPWEPGGFALFAFALATVGLVTAILLAARLLNPRRRAPEKDRPYECGVIPTDASVMRYPAPFALVAMVFLIFDVETAFIYTWAVSFERMDVASFLYMAAFIGVLLVSLWYLCLKGGLQWGAQGRR